VIMEKKERIGAECSDARLYVLYPFYWVPEKSSCRHRQATRNSLVVDNYALPAIDVTQFFIIGISPSLSE